MEEVMRNGTQSIRQLLQEHPRGFSVESDGTIRPIEGAVRIGSFAQLAEIAREPKTLQLALTEKRVIEIEVRPLNSVEATEADKVDPGMPPKVVKEPARGGKAAVEEYNFHDEVYKRRLQECYELKRAFLIDKGVVGFSIEGETLEQKRDWLSANFQPRVLEALRAAIMGLTSDEIATASFI